MGRPSLADVRTAEILEAFERCVALYGLEGSTLERVAEVAGMKRSILRHYVGNREELIRALAERVVSKYRANYLGALERFSDPSRIKQLLDFFFPNQPIDSAESVLVIEALIAAGDRYPDVQVLVLGYVDELVDATTDQLRAAFPSASRQRCWQAAYGIVSICFNQESLRPLGMPPKYLKAARACAKQLIASLQD